MADTSHRPGQAPGFDPELYELARAIARLEPSSAVDAARFRHLREAITSNLYATAFGGNREGTER